MRWARAARADFAALVDVGVPEVRLINRTLSKIQEVSLSLCRRVSVYGWGAANDCLSGLLSDTVVTDIAYTLLMTSYS